MKKAILIAVACSFVAMPAYAAKDKHHGMWKGKKDGYEYKMDKMLEKMDRDRDGRISMNEHEAYSARLFSKIDANNDRTITRQELASYQQNKRLPKDAHKDKYGYNE